MSKFYLHPYDLWLSTFLDCWNRKVDVMVECMVQWSSAIVLTAWTEQESPKSTTLHFMEQVQRLQNLFLFSTLIIRFSWFSRACLIWVISFFCNHTLAFKRMILNFFQSAFGRRSDLSDKIYCYCLMRSVCMWSNDVQNINCIFAS